MRLPAFLARSLLASLGPLLALRAAPEAAPAPDRSFAVVVYNVENLHDLDGVALYDEFQGTKYTSAHVAVKIANITTVLAKVDQGAGPAVVAFNEIELDQTPASTVKDYDRWLASVSGTTAKALLAQSPLPAELAGLPAEAWLLKACVDAGLTGYRVVITDEQPRDGAAVRNVLFTRFPVTATRTHPIESARPILEATLDVHGRPLTVFVNHWKSMRGKDPADTEPTRRQNATVLRARLDELLRADPNADILVTGDLNSSYNHKQIHRELGGPSAINDILGSQGNELAIRGKQRDLYNLWFELPSDQRTSEVFDNKWGTLMHLIVARGLYDQNGVQYVDNSFAVLKLRGLNMDAFGRPIAFSRGRVPYGFSDHFPLYARFRPVDANAKDQWMPLARPSETETGPATFVSAEVAPTSLFATALKLSDLPAGSDLRDGTHDGKIFYIEAPATLNEKNYVQVTVGGLVYDVFTHDKELRNTIRDRARADGKLRFYGEIGTFKGNWQFIVHGKEWLK
jgi:endonuclease/exonuclease/phosphatase (EEP) superfamily protein YafD